MCDYNDFEKLPDIYLDYLNSIESFLEEYFLQIKLMDFIVLDNREWENNWSYQDIRQKVMGAISVLKMTKPATIAKELQNLMVTIKQRGDWCTLRDSEPTWFWSDVMKDRNIRMSEDLKSIIEAALVMTISSAGAERVFSEMNLAKDKKKVAC